MKNLDEALIELRNSIIEQHRQVIKAVLICGADKHIIQVSRISSRISLNYLKMIEDRFVFKKHKPYSKDALNLMDILTGISSEIEPWRKKGG